MDEPEHDAMALDPHHPPLAAGPGAGTAPGHGPSRRVVGILLLYYPQYVAHATEVFAAFLKSLSPDYGMVIVRNGGLALPDRPDVLAVVDGDNALREFSGWDSGLRYFKRHVLGDSSELLVFANDTFCHHNRFGVFTRAAFRQSFRDVMNQPRAAAMAGETFRLGKPYAIGGLPSASWVCTYLFAWNRAALLGMDSLTPAMPIDSFYSKNLQGEIVFSGQVSENLSKHITAWLTGSTKTSWKGVDVTGVKGLEKLQGKANSILCEKHLSAAAISRGLRLVNVFESNVWLRLRKIESLANRFGRWFGRQHSDVYGK